MKLRNGKTYETKVTEISDLVNKVRKLIDLYNKENLSDLNKTTILLTLFEIVKKNKTYFVTNPTFINTFQEKICEAYVSRMITYAEFLNYSTTFN